MISYLTNGYRLDIHVRMAIIRRRAVSLLLRLSVEEKEELLGIAEVHRISASDVLRFLIRAEHDRLFAQGAELFAASSKKGK